MMDDRTKIQEALFYEFRLEDHVPAGAGWSFASVFPYRWRGLFR